MRIANGEVSGLGMVSEQLDKKGRLRSYIVDDIYLIKQQCSGTDTVLDAEAVAIFLGDLATQGIDISKLKLWWHSHGDMKVFWSATDEACVANLANSSYMISIVTNKDKDMLTRIDIYKPFHVTVNEIDTDIHYPEEPELEEFCVQEFNTKVTEQIHQFDRLEPMPFPGRGDPMDAEIERLENLVSSGKMSVQEYEDRMTGLYYMETPDAPF